MLDLDAIGKLPEWHDMTDLQRKFALVFLVTSDPQQALLAGYPDSPHATAGEVTKFFRKYADAKAVQNFFRAVLQPSQSEKILREVSTMSGKQAKAETLQTMLRGALAGLIEGGAAAKRVLKPEVK
jgi:hypothetical protein